MTTMIFGLDLNRNISFGILKPTSRLASLQQDFLASRVRTTVVWVRKKLTAGILLRNTWMFASKPALMLKVLTPKLLPGSGSSRYLPKALKKQATRYGSHVICWKGSAKATVCPSSGIANHWSSSTGGGRGGGPAARGAGGGPAGGGGRAGR